MTVKDSSLSCNTGSWYLIRCQPRKEVYAANALNSLLAVSTYVPECKIRSRGEIRSVPFFAGYIFVQVDLGKVPLSRINSNPGVVHLVEFGGEPQSVPPDVIEGIAERLRQLEVLQPRFFRPGDTVRIKRDGPLKDLEMVFVGPTTSSQRVCVLLSFLGRLKEVYVDVDVLEKAPVSEAVEVPVEHAYRPKERYTRGKGRKIKHLA